MKKIIALLIVTILLNSCMVEYHPVITFTKPTQGNTFENDIIKFELGEGLSCTKIGYKIENKTDDFLEIDWNRAAFVVNGEAFRIYEGDMKYFDANKEQMKQNIPSKTFKKGNIYSGKNPTFSSYGGFSGWNAECFLGGNKKEYKGKEIGLKIPITYQNTTKVYEFTLVVSDVIKRNSNMLLE